MTLLTQMPVSDFICRHPSCHLSLKAAPGSKESSLPFHRQKTEACRPKNKTEKFANYLQ